MKTLHFIGICGTGMATLAAILKRRGFEIRGSDQHVYPPMSTFLEAEGIRIQSGYDAAHVTSDVDLVVVGNAISRGNPEVELVLERKIRYCSMPEAIREFCLWGARSVVVTGTHGKTTTAALIGWLLTRAGLDPSVLVGGVVSNFGDGGSSYRIGGGRDFVIEGDEYDSAFFDKTAKFLKYLPDIGVIGNIEFDHADIYPDLAAVRLAFRRFVNLIPRNGLLVLGADSPDALALREAAPAGVETFGLGEADWHAFDLEAVPGGTRFRASHSGRSLGAFTMGLVGAHNVRNALAALAVAHRIGLDAEEMRAGLREFVGVRRRLELVGAARGVRVYDDFAHHPTAVRETLNAVRTASPGARVWAVFEPRSASSCRRIFQEAFAESFDAADETVIAGVFRSSLPPGDRLSPEALVASLRARGKRARYLPSVGEIVPVIAGEAREGDVIIAMSNGGFDGIHRKLLEALER